MEYAVHAMRERLAELGIGQSMNRSGQMNGCVIESFFPSTKSDVIHWQPVR
jgi:hypothetical protein